MGSRRHRERIEPRFGDDAPELAARRDDDRGGRRRRGRPRRSLLRGLAYWTFTLAMWGVIGLTAFFAYHAMKLPPIDQIAVPRRPPNIAVVARDGTLVANRGETGGGNVSYRELPPYLPQAFVSIEDRRFRSHYGVDPIGIARAVFRNLTGGRVTEGGSTLTQQLAKNLFLTQERTASRKVQEAILALWLERNYTKDQILELYMNRVYFGSGAYGVEAAAQRYFGKSARALTLAEAAILAGLVQAPSRLAPNRNPEAAADRAALVIAAMVRDGAVREADAKTALAEPARARRQAGAGSSNYAADWVVDMLDDFIGAVEQDIVVKTTLDPELQKRAEQALVAELDAKGERLSAGQGALVAMAPDGGVRALVGGRSYGESQFNRAVAAKRQPGSAFKPFVYLTALENGYQPDSVVIDAPVNIRGWRPENYSREYFGEVTLQQALAMSLNTPVVRLINEIGPRATVRAAQRLGVNSPLKPVPSLALGTSEVTPIELAAAYAAFANGGTAVIPYAITEVRTASGKVIYAREPRDLGRAMTPEQAGQMNRMLRETLVSGTARRAELPGHPAAGKTGTTQDYTDAWFVGYTGQLVAAVWVGNDDNEPMKKVSGSGLPAEIWRRFMSEAHAGKAVVALPGLDWRSDRAAAPVAGQPPAPPANVGSIPPRRQPAPPAPPPSADGDPLEFVRQSRPPAGPSREERSLLQRLIGG